MRASKARAKTRVAETTSCYTFFFLFAELSDSPSQSHLQLNQPNCEKVEVLGGTSGEAI